MQLTVPAARACRILAAALIPLSFITPASAYLMVDASSYINNDVEGLFTERVSVNSDNGYQAGDTIQSLVSRGADLSQTRAKADYGTLGLFAESAIASTLTTRNVSSAAQAGWNDTITISGGAPGTNVKLLATIVLDVGQLDAAASGTYASAWSDIRMSTGFGASRSWCGTSADGPLAGQVIDSCNQVGGSIGVGRNEISFEVETTVGAHQWGVQMSMTSYLVRDIALGEVGSADAIGDALNTAHSYFTVLTPGATMQWASGHDYSLPPVQAVPEPSTHALLVAGLVVLGFAARRRRGH